MNAYFCFVIKAYVRNLRHIFIEKVFEQKFNISIYCYWNFDVEGKKKLYASRKAPNCLLFFVSFESYHLF